MVLIILTFIIRIIVTMFGHHFDFNNNENTSDTFDAYGDGDDKVCLTLAEVMVAGKAVIPGWGKNSIINTTITLSTTTMITTPTYTTMVIPSLKAANNIDITASRKCQNCQESSPIAANIGDIPASTWAKRQARVATELGTANLTIVIFVFLFVSVFVFLLGKEASQSHSGIGGRQPDRL